MPFGLGTRNCIDKNISMLGMTKGIPELLKGFDFKLVGELKGRNEKLE